MCLGIPGEIVEIDEPSEQGALLQGTVSFGGVRKQICLAYVPEARVGDYVIVHAGFALNLVDEQNARAIFETLAEVERVASNQPGNVTGNAGQVRGFGGGGP